MLLLRDRTHQPFPPWLLGTVGSDISVALNPHPRMSVKVHWVPAFTNASLDLSAADIGAALDANPDWQPPIRILNRVVVGVEIGL
jgi:hypothetical protein